MASLSSTTVSDFGRSLFPGIHSIFSGQEQGYTGSGDPFNREAYVQSLQRII